MKIKKVQELNEGKKNKQIVTIQDCFVVEIDGDKELVVQFQEWIIKKWNKLSVLRGGQYLPSQSYSKNFFGTDSREMIEKFFNGDYII